jgi:hypothetical protein
VVMANKGIVMRWKGLEQSCLYIAVAMYACMELQKVCVWYTTLASYLQIS